MSHELKNYTHHAFPRSKIQLNTAKYSPNYEIDSPKYQIQWDDINTHHNLAPIELLLGFGEPLLQTLQFCSSVGLGTIR